MGVNACSYRYNRYDRKVYATSVIAAVFAQDKKGVVIVMPTEGCSPSERQSMARRDRQDGIAAI